MRSRHLSQRWSEGHLSADADARFHTKSGLLIGQKQRDWIQLDFPINHSELMSCHPELSQALGVPLKTVMKNSLGYLVEVDSEDLVRRMKPNFSQLRALSLSAVIVTSLADQDSPFDFVSRFFGPGFGIDEDPVTGAAHCCLAPFWRDRLGKDDFSAYQASARGGVLRVRHQGDRVYQWSSRHGDARRFGVEMQNFASLYISVSIHLCLYTSISTEFGSPAPL